MTETDCIEQQGTVEKISGNKVQVRISQISGCGLCHAKGFCSVTEMKERIIEATYNFTDIAEGDVVLVSMTRSMGNKAVTLGYVLPFIILITVLLVMDSSGAREWISGTAALSVLVPYYLSLYFFRNRLKRTFTFMLNKNK
jgi:positive regulator of sigma E activity